MAFCKFEASELIIDLILIKIDDPFNIAPKIFWTLNEGIFSFLEYEFAF